MKSKILGLLAVGLLAVPMAASALVVGTDNSDNCYPFTCTVADYGQVYSSGYFAGPISIGSIAFFQDNALPAASLASGANWTIFLSTTASAIGASSLLDGPDILQVYSGGSPVLAGGKFTFTLSNVFAYNPSGGNLLLRVLRSGGVNPATISQLAAQTWSSNCQMSRTLFGGTGGSCLGLVTEFGVVPEPGTLALLGLGLAGLGLSRRRKAA